MSNFFKKLFVRHDWSTKGLRRTCAICEREEYIGPKYPEVVPNDFWLPEKEGDISKHWAARPPVRHAHD